MNQKKLIWAVDPFERPVSLRNNVLHVLKYLSTTLKVKIEPVYILRPKMDYALDFAAPLYQELASSAGAAMGELEAAYHLPLLPPRIVTDFSSSLTSAVDDLIAYAEKSKAEFIVANTHARSGVKRMVLGSFAETLLLRSTVPVITVNPNARRIVKMSHILFSTDFGQGSYRAFKRAVELARQLSAKVTLFHMIPYPVQIYSRGNVFFTGRYEFLAQSFVREEKNRAKLHSEKWIKWARSKGVSTELTLHSEEGNVAEKLIKTAKSLRVSAIMMESLRGPSASVLLGSTTRQVVRGAPCPVWIIHSKYAERVRSQANRGKKRAA